MFQPNIVSLCDEEQQARWLPLCRDWRMIGCYAQTELGHGSNIRALETTATFLPESKGGDKGGSWIINSPTLTSGKFWPGTLGRTANVRIVPELFRCDNFELYLRLWFVCLRLIFPLTPLLKFGWLSFRVACYGYRPVDWRRRQKARNPQFLGPASIDGRPHATSWSWNGRHWSQDRIQHHG